MALLTKLSGLFVTAAAALVLLHAARHGARSRVAAVAFAVGALAVAGWWYARNLILFGDPTGLPLMWASMPRRAAPPDPRELVEQLIGVWRSYWAVFGWLNLPAPPTADALVDALALGGLLGAVLAATRGDAAERRGLAVAGVLAAGMAAGIVAWARLQFPQGRLFFPGAPALSILLAAGWAALGRLAAGVGGGGGERDGPTRGDRAALVPGAVLAPLAVALFGWVVLPAYRPPAPRPVAPGEPVWAVLASRTADGAPMDAEVSLGRFAVNVAPRAGVPAADAPRRAAPGDRVLVDLVWRAEAPVPTDLSIFLHVVDGDGLVIAQHDGMPADGKAPTSDWPVGAWIDDRQTFVLPPGTPPCTGCRLRAGLYDPRGGARLSVVAIEAAGIANGLHADGGGDEDARGAIDLGPLDVLPATGGDGLAVRFGNRMVLDGYELPTRVVSPGATLPLTLTWRATGRPAGDYTVSVQLRRGAAETWGQRDERPLEGARPTDSWRRGDVVVDPVPIVVSPDAPPGVYTLFVKVYEPGVGGLPVNLFDAEWAVSPIRVRRGAEGEARPGS